MKYIFLFGLALISFFAVVIYWGLKPFEDNLISTANTSSTVNMSNYPGFVETVNYWPVVGWLLLISLIGYVAYRVIKR